MKPFRWITGGRGRGTETPPKPCREHRRRENGGRLETPGKKNGGMLLEGQAAILASTYAIDIDIGFTAIILATLSSDTQRSDHLHHAIK